MWDELSISPARGSSETISKDFDRRWVKRGKNRIDLYGI